MVSGGDCNIFYIQKIEPIRFKGLNFRCKNRTVRAIHLGKYFFIGINFHGIIAGNTVISMNLFRTCDKSTIPAHNSVFPRAGLKKFNHRGFWKDIFFIHKRIIISPMVPVIKKNH